MRNFPKSLLVAVPFAFAALGCAGVNTALQQTNAALTAVNNTLSGAASVNVDAALAAPPKALAQDVTSATPMVKDLVTTSACLPAGAAKRYLARFYDGSGYGIAYADPKLSMRYNQSRCLGVDRVGNWEQPAKNVLKFTVTYVSDSSGESALERYTIQRNDSARWYLRGF